MGKDATRLDANTDLNTITKPGIYIIPDSREDIIIDDFAIIAKGVKEKEHPEE